MSTDKSDQEPSMEEILSSIRRIIADDEEDGAPAKKAPADAGPEPKKEPEAQEPEDDDVLDLTQVVARGTDAAGGQGRQRSPPTRSSSSRRKTSSPSRQRRHGSRQPSPIGQQRSGR